MWHTMLIPAAKSVGELEITRWVLRKQCWFLAAVLSTAIWLKLVTRSFWFRFSYLLFGGGNPIAGYTSCNGCEIILCLPRLGEGY